MKCDPVERNLITIVPSPDAHLLIQDSAMSFRRYNVTYFIGLWQPKAGLKHTCKYHSQIVHVHAGRSGLAVACLTAVRESWDRIALRAVVFIAKTTAIYSLGHGLCALFLQCLGQLSFLPYVGR